jgi:hypothetical protein
MLGLFYMEARKLDGQLYHGNSLKSLRYALNRHLKSPPPQQTLTGNKFVLANMKFKTVMQELKSVGKADTKHFDSISPEDLEKLYKSLYMRPSTPAGLQNKVQFDLRLYFARRGNENMAALYKTTFVVKTNSNGLNYVERSQGEAQKNHNGNDPEKASSGIMPERPDHPLCPVRSFELYLSKLNPKFERLWQYPVDAFNDDDEIWYYNKPMGINTLRTFMQTFSKQTKQSNLHQSLHSLHICYTPQFHIQSFRHNGCHRTQKRELTRDLPEALPPSKGGDGLPVR